jgi:hypothetical protein
LDDEDKDLLDSEVTGAEIEKVITLLKKETSPGEDGIISEFYQEYRNSIKSCNHLLELNKYLPCTKPFWTEPMI